MKTKIWQTASQDQARVHHFIPGIAIAVITGAAAILTRTDRAQDHRVGVNSTQRCHSLSLKSESSRRHWAAGYLSVCSAILSYMAHGENQHEPSELDREFTQAVAETMQALATPSRLRILGRLHAGACPVNELASAVGMESSAVSHQLRLLRHLGLVVGRRDGRQVVYDLHDDHVGELLDQAISHVEHLRQGRSRATRQVELQAGLR